MATITEMADATKPNPSVNSPADRLSNVVERTADMSVELLKSLETGELAAIDAVGTFAISIEDGLTEQVTALPLWRRRS